MKDFLDLIKVRILVSALFTVVLGYVVGLPDIFLFSWTQIFYLCLSCSFIFSASAALNHVLEVDVDALMTRTENRPLVQRRIKVGVVVFLSVLSIFLGVLIQAYQFNYLLVLNSVLIFILYVLVYTPLKRLSSWNTIIGAFPGAMPFFCGLFVYQHTLNEFSLILFAIFYLWQLPHFYAISWINRDSYEKAGLKMLSVGDVSGDKTYRYLLVSTLVFVAVTLLPFLLQYLSWVYFVFVLLLGIYLCRVVIAFSSDKSNATAKKILMATIFYPPVLLIVIIFDIIIRIC
jgi:protoheme IX farnesyltransferase